MFEKLNVSRGYPRPSRIAEEVGKTQDNNNYKHLHNNDTWSPWMRALFFSKVLPLFHLIKGSPTSRDQEG
jgi:hypothetical protein